jgi:hypothetical protein
MSPFPLVLSTGKVEAIDMLMAPVLQNMLILQEICARPAMPLSLEDMKVDLSVTSSVRSDSDSPLSWEQLEVNP